VGNNRGTVRNRVFYGGPCQEVIRRTTGTRIYSLKGAAIQRGLEHVRRGIDIVRSHYEETSNSRLRTHVCVCVCVCEREKINDGTIIKYKHELFVKVVNKSNIQSKTPSRVALTHDKIFNFRSTW
jgi:hypothetical protein